MLFRMRKTWAALIVGSMLPVAAHSANTKTAYPAKPITIVVGFTQGTAVDTLTRLVAAEMEQELGVDILVENRLGGTSNVAADYVARSTPDGYTLFIATRPNATYGAMQARPTYDLTRDLQAVGLMATLPFVVIAGRHTAITTIEEMVARARKKPPLSCASPGVGSTGHFLCEEFKKEAQGEVVHAPYNYVDQALTHIISGHLDIYFLGLTAALPYIRAGAVHAIAVSGEGRAPLAPAIPTFRELGFGKVHDDAWLGLVAPTGTPPRAIDALNRALNRALARPRLRGQLLNLGYSLPFPPNNARLLTQLMMEETKRWNDFIGRRWSAPGKTLDVNRN
ncbi:tripartite tricarboxylate transporter substrate-binding protein [Achromobacter aloeverae]|uniref:Tripartite tricarboxylate transporter substrate binding protein n=1 Tax=Achromobacter aloeverae TaxID=1750518 RepID=A0A4Q1HL55_9BURK|nr:tripartite tricarboxylate transporter substrate-binding protein [Achromobacter aloeverae]RXN91171.1 hypothetical protein C7R54_08255 [Achromobacter aloeverae]